MIHRFVSAAGAPGLAAGLASIALVGCATQPNPLVTELEQRYERTAADPHVSEFASVELYEADQAVERVEQAWKRDRDRGEFEHLATLARQRLEIAEVQGQAGALRASIEQLGEERDELQLRARELEALTAQQRAERAQMAADLARMEATDADRLADKRARELSELRARAEELESQLENLRMQEDERGLVFLMSDVLFEFDSATLKAGASRTLSQVGELLQRYPDRRISIEGHTDAVGDESYNRRLSKARADAVATFLEDAGVAAARIRSVGLGESAPIATNETQAGRQENRRVVVVLENADPSTTGGAAPSSRSSRGGGPKPEETTGS